MCQRHHQKLAIESSNLDYRFDLVSAFYTFDFYPLILAFHLESDKEVECNNEEEFKEEFEKILKSDITRNRISKLLLLSEAP